MPGNLQNPPINRRIADRLLKMPAFKQIASYGSSKPASPCSTILNSHNLSGQFAFWFPKIYQHYCNRLQPLFRRYPHLRHNFTGSIFPACTFNLSDDTITFLHADTGNAAGGPCAITSAGIYDHKKGGHIILWNYKLVVEFPSGSTALIPSASVFHGNTPIQPGETRYSFTQYCAGGLLRWVDYGFQSVKSCAVANPSLKRRLDSLAGVRWRKALRMFSKLSNVHEDRVKAFNL